MQVVQTREIKKQRRASGKGGLDGRSESRHALVVQVSPSAAPAHRQSVVVTMLVERFDNALDMVAGRGAEAPGPAPAAALRKSVVATPDDLQRRPSTFRRVSALVFSSPAAKVADTVSRRMSRAPPAPEKDLELFDIYEESSSDDDEESSRRAPPPAKFVKPKAYNIYDANADSDDEADESGRSSKKVKSVRRNA